MQILQKLNLKLFLIKSIFILSAALCWESHAQSRDVQDIDTIESILKQQMKAWNEGNVAQFMVGYWESDSLKFIGKKGVVKGYQATLERYKKNYPNKATMGQLTFHILHKEKLAKKVAFIVGRWQLKRDKMENLEGHFSLIWKKIKGEWVIVADHSS